MKRIVICFFLLFSYAYARDGFGLVNHNKGASLYYQGNEQVIHTAIDMLVDDSKSVCIDPFSLSDSMPGGTVVIGVVNQDRAFKNLLATHQVDISGIRDKWEAFQIQVVGTGKKRYLFVVGSDPRGAAYGVLELSRLIGISPWKWWADVTPEKKTTVSLPADYKTTQYPSVQYRGIFLNDEDWGLNPWSSGTFEPEAKLKEGIDLAKTRKMKTIGPKTYAKIFELLLRLRANTIWPAMHEVTVPFYFVEGNREAAERYGIYIGSSHCEPLARNSATEWDISGIGEYNYLTNKDHVISYWTDRLKELGSSNNIFTIGMRGKHDGPMEGVKTTEEYKEAISKVIADQTELLKTYINPDPSKVPQVIIPYKEVLDVYKAGLDVPDYVTLMWCDDNYGYITHFPDTAEKNRSGGNGIYYHASYWGRPHDYLWLGTANPVLLYQQMKLAYDKGVRKIWILNVGDIKAIEYQTELFLDMAWDIDGVADGGVNAHLYNWLGRDFGEHAADRFIPLMQEYYRLAYIRKPEFMGNTREEERDPAYKVIKDLPWSEEEISGRLRAYNDLSDQVEKLTNLIPAHRQAAYFELVKYPVQAASQMNRKLLYAQLARHGKAEWRQSHAAFDSIAALTHQYDTLKGGKWDKMLDYKPRNLPVFQQVKEEQAAQPLPTYRTPRYVFNGIDFTSSTTEQTPIEGLGYEGKALALQKGSSITFDLPHLPGDSVFVEVRLLPNHPVEGEQLRFGIALNDTPMKEIDYRTLGRSEEWKENVLRNQAIRKVAFPVAHQSNHRLTLKALDAGVVIDQVLVYGRSEGGVGVTI
ncbi:glycosyl hydrolase 115 family protein [Parapedobacter tibetensis]|uniref:glycosyl hydrolase 115 family protein n=1 Tax=Parapedobacter tibetensis TaxID=2972951 RepID=UPI00214D53E0|nr:glycosyl hydrolase 115 family protein [Parapedobacter tibetensis]